MSEGVNPKLEFNCSVCKKPSIFDKEITYVGKVGSTQVQLCDSCSKNNDNMVLKTMYDRNLESELENQLDKMINRGENNSNVGSFVSRCNFRYGHDRQNPFCNEPLNYVLQTDLTEEYEFSNLFTKPIKDFLKDDTSSPKQQGLITNGYQTDGNIFEDKNIDTHVLQKIIEFEVEKYRHKFKDSEEGFLKNWPEEYTLNGWLISMKSGGKLKPHMHEHGWLSGSIYINVPKKKTVDSGNLVVCIDDEDETNKKSIDVVTGSLCLFPASLLHYTIPFESDEERIVLAFDVKPKIKGDNMAKEEVIIDADNTYKDPRAVYDDVGNIINQVYDDTPNLKRDALGNVIGNVNDSDGEGFEITSPRTNKEYSFDTSVLTGADWSRMFNSVDDIFTPEEIKKYHEFAIHGPSSNYKDLTDLGPEIKDFWIQEIWDRANPGVQLLSHSININESCEFKVNAWAGNQYTVIVYLTPDLQPTDGGALELWTPNLTDKTKAMAINTQYSFDMSEEYNKEILKSYWPRPGRYVVFDSRIPNIARPIETDKVRVALIFKGTTIGYTEPTDETQFTVVE